jgi:hypothetical protein
MDKNMSKLNNFFSDCLKLPYRPNSQDNPEHENQVEELLIAHGLEYVAQPNGIQNSPDFYVYYNNKRYSIECKSSKGHYPVYNGGLPKVDAIYIFSSKKYNKTTIYNANDILTLSKRELYNSMLMEMQQVLEKYRELDEWKDKRGFDFYIRSMYTQSGGKHKVDYFFHEDREMCERNVLNAEY